MPSWEGGKGHHVCGMEVALPDRRLTTTVLAHVSIAKEESILKAEKEKGRRWIGLSLEENFLSKFRGERKDVERTSEVNVSLSLSPKCQVNKSKNGEAKNPQKERVNLPERGRTENGERRFFNSH